VIARVDILGVGISAVDMSGAVDEIARWIKGGERQYVCVTGVHGVMESQRDADLKDIHNRSGLTTPDGMSTVWLSRWAGAKHTTRVYGPDLMPAVCELAAAEGWRVYFYGSAPGVPEEVAKRLQDRFPGLQVAGTCSPPFRPLTPEEDAEIVDAINRAEPHVVWVGLSTPKQERWMAAHRSQLGAPVLIGVGAAFDQWAGLVRRAPRWIQRAGLEWAFRIMKEPRRLWRRYFDAIPRYIWANLRNPPRVRDGSRA
jgi:N-acetylglucosaminyldiphosphoundecaprenol N-acetyl-beta-D-mannosaminyltransferase